MFELMPSRQTRQTPYGDHPQRNGNSDHNRTAEDIGCLHLAVGEGRARSVDEKQTGGERTGRSGHPVAQKSLSQSGTSLLLESVCEKNQRGRDRAYRRARQWCSRCQNRSVRAPMTR